MAAYIVRCADNSLYTGIALDVRGRIEKHNSGQGAKYTRSHGPVTLVKTESYKTEGEARKREAYIKSLTKIKKERLLPKLS
ncbi:MAG: GIY-YIG nuclease family protein [Patescibacteria group bacterium]